MKNLFRNLAYLILAYTLISCTSNKINYLDKKMSRKIAQVNSDIKSIECRDSNSSNKKKIFIKELFLEEVYTSDLNDHMSIDRIEVIDCNEENLPTLIDNEKRYGFGEIRISWREDGTAVLAVWNLEQLRKGGHGFRVLPEHAHRASFSMKRRTFSYQSSRGHGKVPGKKETIFNRVQCILEAAKLACQNNYLRY